MRPDWRAAYHRTQRETVELLRRLRSEGRTFYRFGDSGPACDPSRLSDRSIEDLALRHAERVTVRAINTHEVA
ncbi:MAG TPA: hypothetical protein VIK91_11560 [Nannocystis sp.]